MTEDELNLYSLCGPLADAIDMLDAENVPGARAVLARILERAQQLYSEKEDTTEPL